MIKYTLGDSRSTRAHAAACVVRTVAGEVPYAPHVGTAGGISAPMSLAAGGLMIGDAVKRALPRVKVRSVRSVASLEGRLEATFEVS